MRSKNRNEKELGKIVERMRGVIIPASVLQLRREEEQERARCRQLEMAMQPALQVWLAENGRRAVRLSEDELDELFSLFGVGGPITKEGIEHFVKAIERKRHAKVLLGEIMDTELIDTMETLLKALHERCQPYRGRR